MFGWTKRIVSWIKRKRTEAAIAIALANIAVLGQTTTIDTSSMVNMINSFLPLIIAIFSLMIPLIFLGKIFEMIEKLFSKFGS